MAIEMIENSELPAMMSSRLGGRNFITDAPVPSRGKKRVPKKEKYLMVTGIDQTFRDKVISLYDSIKGDKGAVQEAKTNVLSDSGLVVVRKVTSKYGLPSNAEGLRERNAAFQVMRDFQVNSAMDCAQLTELLDKINAEISARNENLTSGSKSKVENRFIRVLNDVKKEVESLMKKNQCAVKAAQAEEASATAETLSALKGATTDVQQKSKTTQYVIFGVGGVIVLGAIYLLFKGKKNE